MLVCTVVNVFKTFLLVCLFVFNGPSTQIWSYDAKNYYFSRNIRCLNFYEDKQRLYDCVWWSRGKQFSLLGLWARPFHLENTFSMYRKNKTKHYHFQIILFNVLRFFIGCLKIINTTFLRHKIFIYKLHEYSLTISGIIV